VPEPRVITVEIAGQRYPIRSTLDAGYVTELAAYVERKMRAASDAAPSSDGVGLAILVALNVADELFRVRDRQSVEGGRLNSRAMQLERIVDDALAQLPPATTPVALTAR
jgi:cell division protein ZapA